jgi:hypothetical protein
MIRRYQVNIWFVEKWRKYPRVKYYEAETKKEVTTKVKEEFPNYKELLIMEVPTHPHEARHPENDG